MQAEDNYCLSLNKNALCLWNKFSGKEIPKKHHNNKSFRGFYNRHMKGLKKAFKEGEFEVRYKEGFGFGVYILSTAFPKNKRTRRQ
eukprot:12795951-Ditylum_brightwellii.AAC.1